MSVKRPYELNKPVTIRGETSDEAMAREKLTDFGTWEGRRQVSQHEGGDFVPCQHEFRHENVPLGRIAFEIPEYVGIRVVGVEWSKVERKHLCTRVLLSELLKENC
jgi:hypothetical protein